MQPARSKLVDKKTQNVLAEYVKGPGTLQQTSKRTHSRRTRDQRARAQLRLTCSLLFFPLSECRYSHWSSGPAFPFRLKHKGRASSIWGIVLILHAQDHQGTSVEPGQNSSASLCVPTSCAGGKRSLNTQVLGEQGWSWKESPDKDQHLPTPRHLCTPQLCVVLEGNSSPARDTPTLECRGPEQSPGNQQEKLIQTKIQKIHAKPKAQGFTGNDPVRILGPLVSFGKTRLHWSCKQGKIKRRTSRFPKVKVRISWGVLGEMTFGATFAEYLRFQTKAYLYYESIHQPLNDSPSHTKPQPPQKPSYCYYPKRDLHFQVKGGKNWHALLFHRLIYFWTGSELFFPLFWRGFLKGDRKKLFLTLKILLLNRNKLNAKATCHF